VHSPDGTEESHEKLRIFGAPVEIQTGTSRTEVRSFVAYGKLLGYKQIKAKKCKVVPVLN
jgi:hypothetical protein